MLKEKVYRLFEEQSDAHATGRWIRMGLLILILLNVLSVILQSVESIDSVYRRAFQGFEFISVCVFSIEYLARIWSITVDRKYRGFWGRFRYALTPLAIIDLIAILPSILSMNFVDLRFLRIARLFRLLRILKVGRYSKTLQKFSEVAVETRSEMAVTFLAMLLLLVVGSGTIYFVEHEAQPEVFSSIPASMWWAVTTLTTVGYGDTYPITAFGKLAASLVAIFGIGMFALPSGILGAAFLARIKGERHDELVCPHCHRKFGEDEGE